MTIRSLLAITLAIGSHSASAQPSVFTDTSPHSARFVTANAVRLEVLDWGGRGTPLLLLAGLGNSAHIFDDIAPKLATEHRVIAITRRGHGASDKPTTGYDLPTLVEDIRMVLDSLHIDQVSLVAHSFAGDEATLFATKHPERVTRVIYLEAAYDRSLRAPPNPSPTPRPTSSDLASFEAYHAYFDRARGYWSNAVEADLRATSLADDGTLKSTLSRDAMQGIMANTKNFTLTYSGVRAPVLAVYNRPTDSARLAFEEENIRKLTSEHPKNLRVEEYQNSNHYLFIVNQAAVLKDILSFVP